MGVPFSDANAIAPFVGRQIRLRRLELGLSQGELASASGVSRGTLQRYEAASLTVGAARLYEISKALSVSVSFFFPTAAVVQDAGAKPLFGEPLDGVEREAPAEGSVARDMLRAVLGEASILDFRTAERPWVKKLH